MPISFFSLSLNLEPVASSRLKMHRLGLKAVRSVLVVRGLSTRGKRRRLGYEGNCCRQLQPLLPAFAAAYELVTIERRGAVGLITLNRPKALNALNSALVGEINVAARELDADDAVGAIVITGSDRAFAAGADIKEMAKKEFVECYSKNMVRLGKVGSGLA